MRSSIRSVSSPLLVLLTLSASRAAAAPPEAVAPLAPPAQPPERQPIEMREVTWGGRHGELRHKPVPFQGNLMLDDAALFRVLGRDDLLRDYQQRAATRTTITVLGVLAFVGAGFALAEARPTLECSPGGDCVTRRSDGAVAAGIALLAAGASLIVADATLSTTPISDDQRAALVDQYNRTLPNPSSRAPR